MTWLLRLAALAAGLLFLRWLWRWFWTVGWKRLLASAVEPLSQSSRPPAYRGTVKRDPVCGTHVDVAMAVQERVNGEILYFCSERCRQSFHARQQQPVSKTG